MFKKCSQLSEVTRRGKISYFSNYIWKVTMCRPREAQRHIGMSSASGSKGPRFKTLKYTLYMSPDSHMKTDSCGILHNKNPERSFSGTF